MVVEESMTTLCTLYNIDYIHDFSDNSNRCKERVQLSGEE